MEAFNFNSSIISIHTMSNSSIGGVGRTVYERCEHMPEAVIFYVILQLINFFLGIPANLMVLWRLHKNKEDSSTSDIFILHLAILDTFFCLLPPIELNNIFFFAINGTRYTLYFFYGIKDTSPLFLACICLDRYMAVLHPITFTELKDRSHRTVSMIVIWIIALAHGAAKCAGKIPNIEKAFVVMILTSFAIMLFCNVAILHALRKSGPTRDEMHPVKKRAFKMVLIILAIIVFNYFPPVALYPFQENFSRKVFFCYVNFIAFGFMDISSSIQPVLYLSREKIPSVLCCCHKNGESTDPKLS